MKNSYLDFSNYKKRVLKQPEIRRQYDKLQPEFAVIEAVLKARMNKGVTQKELAKRTGTKQTAISRLESGRANPSINFLKKIASALNQRLEIRFVPA